MRMLVPHPCRCSAYCDTRYGVQAARRSPPATARLRYLRAPILIEPDERSSHSRTPMEKVKIRGSEIEVRGSVFSGGTPPLDTASSSRNTGYLMIYPSSFYIGCYAHCRNGSDNEAADMAIPFYTASIDGIDPDAETAAGTVS